MQYKVPHNIDQEDKIFGPLTFVQFVYVLIGGALLLIAFTTLNFTLFVLVAIPIVLFTIAFALVRVQDQPFSRILLAFLVYLRQPKKRLWHAANADNATGDLSQTTTVSPSKTVTDQLPPLPDKPVKQGRALAVKTEGDS